MRACFLSWAFSYFIQIFCLPVCLTVIWLMLIAIANSNGMATASMNSASFEFVRLALKLKRSLSREEMPGYADVFIRWLWRLTKKAHWFWWHLLNVRFGLAFSSFPLSELVGLFIIKHELIAKILLLTLWKNVRPAPYSYSDVIDGNKNASVPRFRIQIRVGRS